MKSEKVETALSSQNALAFILAGNATFTIRSMKTGTRYTFKVKRAETTSVWKNAMWFVSLLVGPSNESDYTYIGVIRDKNFSTTTKSRMSLTSTPVVAISWVLSRLAEAKDLPNAEVWHSGTCGRCGRTLTVPESIASGIGPECGKHMMQR